jgi:hypothetical protein
VAICNEEELVAAGGLLGRSLFVKSRNTGSGGGIARSQSFIRLGKPQRSHPTTNKMKPYKLSSGTHADQNYNTSPRSN